MVSIIIPAYNEEYFIEHLLISIKKQTYKQIEIIVADNHSRDKTRAIARKYGARVVNGGIPSVARNRGAEIARGRYLLFIDADQEITRSFVARLVARVEKKKIDICVPRLSPLNERGLLYLILLPAHGIYLKLMERIKPQGSGACIFVTRTLHNGIAGFDETRKLSEDHDYILRASRLGKFRVLRDMHVNFSVRRFYEEGVLISLYKIIKAAMLHIFTGKADEKVEYEFGQFRHNYAKDKRPAGDKEIRQTISLIFHNLIAKFSKRLSYSKQRKD